MSSSGTIFLELKYYCKLQTLSWKTTVTVVVYVRDNLVRILRISQQQTLSWQTTVTVIVKFMTELKYNYQLKTLFWKTSVTVSVISRDLLVRNEGLLSTRDSFLEVHCQRYCLVRDSLVRIEELLSTTDSFWEDHCHCSCQLQGLSCKS